MTDEAAFGKGYARLTVWPQLYFASAAEDAGHSMALTPIDRPNHSFLPASSHKTCPWSLATTAPLIPRAGVNRFPEHAVVAMVEARVERSKGALPPFPRLLSPALGGGFRRAVRSHWDSLHWGRDVSSASREKAASWDPMYPAGILGASCINPETVPRTMQAGLAPSQWIGYCSSLYTRYPVRPSRRRPHCFHQRSSVSLYHMTLLHAVKEQTRLGERQMRNLGSN
jgi:hypothetical protein